MAEEENSVHSHAGSWIPAIREFIEHQEDGVHCRIENLDCKYVQKVLRPSNFVRHFRNEHTAVSVEKGFFRYKKARPEQPASAASSMHLHQRLVAERVKNFIERRQDEFHCNINPASECSYRQTHSRKHFFLHHFVTRHPLEAREHGLLEFRTRRIKIARRREVCEEAEKSPKDDAPDIDATVRKHIEFNGEKYMCRISAGFCFYFQTLFNSHNFYRHFYTVHPTKAAESGISRENYLNLVNGPPQQVELQGDPLTEAPSVESFRSHISYEGNSKIQVNQRTRYERRIEDLACTRKKLCDMDNECVRHEGSFSFCQIDEHSNCTFSQQVFNPSNFSRHFRLKHPNVADERGFFKLRPEIKTEKRRRRPCDMVEECVRREGSFTYCQIDIHSECSFVQKKYHPGNFRKHFLRMHPGEAENKGFGSLKKRTTEGSVLESYKLKMANKVPDFIMRRTASSGRMRYLCNIQPESGCSYYEALLHVASRHRFVNHFVRKHPGEALANGFVVQSTCDALTDSAGATISPESSLQQKRKTLKRKRNSVRTLVDKFVIKEGVSARCNIHPESGCTHSQKLYVPFNFARHFYNKHPCAFEEHGFNKTMIGKSGNNQTDGVLEPPEESDIQGLFETSGEGSAIKQEIYEITEIDESAPIPAIKQEFDPLFGLDQRDEGRIGIDADDYVENDSTSNIDYETSASESGSYGERQGNVLKFIREEGNVFHCAMDDGKECGYFQKHLQRTNFRRHFRSVHRETSLRCGFFKTAEKEALRKSKSCDGKQKSITKMVEECVQEKQNVTYCQINIESECTYSQHNFNAHNFARHFRHVHPEEAEERGFFQLTGNSFSESDELGNERRKSRRSLQQSHGDMVFKNTEVDDKGVHCRIAGYCPYVQKKFIASNFERHFRQKHPKEAVEKGFDNVHGEALTQIKKRIQLQKIEKLWKECVAKDEHGAYCRLVPGCTFFQRVFTRPSFRLHFFQMHNEEAIRRGFNEDHGRRSFLLNHPDEASEKGLKRDQTETRSTFGNQTFLSMVFECTISEELGIRCRIDGTDRCPYSQNTFHLMDYLRHFRTVHTEEARSKGFFRTAEEITPRHFVLSRQIMKHVIQTGHELRCGINPSEPCDFTREKFSSRDFLRHFCKHHPDEAEENEFLVEINRSSVGINSEPERSNEESSNDPYVLYENTSIGEVDNKNIDQQLDTPRHDPSTYCRLCFSVTLPLKPVFDLSRHDDRTLAEQVATCAGINLSSETEPHVSICSVCVQKLDDIQQFRQLCQTLDKVVRGKVAKATVGVDTPMEDFVDHPREIQIKDELPDAMDEEEDQNLPGISANLSGDQWQPGKLSSQSAPEVPADPGDDESGANPNHTYPCRECGEKFDSAQTMMLHYKGKHSTAGPLVFVKKYFKCTDCDTVLSDRPGLNAHRQRYHNPEAPPKEKIYCTMPNCTQFFMGLIPLRRHLKTFHGLTDPAQLALMSILKCSE